MVKTFCDMCGSEIDKKKTEYKLECLKFDKYKEQYTVVYQGENVCEDCIIAINNFISSNLKKKVGD